MHGARLVTCSETERNRHWAESRIKQLTGGDVIAARYMHGNFFNFVPTFKLLVSGNHRPHMRPDSAMRRRFQLIPFVVSIPANERDNNLGTKLEKEWPGILLWMIAGCLAWQRGGLRPPAAVLSATEEYFEEEAEDVLAMWLRESCVADPQEQTPISALYHSFKQYAEQAGERAMTNAQFGKDLKALGFEPKRTNAARFITGLRLTYGAPGYFPLPAFRVGSNSHEHQSNTGGARALSGPHRRRVRKSPRRKVRD